MELICDLTLAAGYKSSAQIARVVSENWLAKYGYCLFCDTDSLSRSQANTKSTDFLCPRCARNYELKAFRTRPSQSLVDGAYSSLMARIMEGSAPSLFLLQRNSEWTIESLTAIHSVFLTPLVVEKRKPLSATAVRAGWVGCNIRLDRIGPDGEIPLIKNGQVLAKDEVRRQFRRSIPLSTISPNERGWTTLTLHVVHKLTKKQFSLSDLYEKEHIFAACYPRNNNVRAKVRQQLQVLRDLGFIMFAGRGKYVLTELD
jgi:type II restriction enzyme